MSFSARPFAEAPAAFERQLAARADRLPERPAAPDEALARAAAAYLKRAEQLGFDRAAAARALRST